MIRPPRRVLSLESLEPRQMMAGNVTVSLAGGNLVISGDEADNEIAVIAGADANTYIVKGLEGTTVTMAGSSTPDPDTDLVVTGVRGRVNVNMAAGNDAVEVSGAEFRHSLSIEMGSGNDSVNVHDVKVGTFLNIVAGEGDDTVNVGTPAEPTAALASDSAASVKVGLAINVLLGDGVDNAQVNSAAAAAIAVGGGMGADTIGLHGVRAFSLAANGGLGDAVDQIDVSGARAVAAVIATGGGNDEVGVVDSKFTALNVALGGGDDSLSLQKVKARVAVLAGGEGSADQYADEGENSLGLKIITGFELPEGVNTARPLPRLNGLLANLFGRLFR